MENKKLSDRSLLLANVAMKFCPTCTVLRGVLFYDPKYFFLPLAKNSNTVMYLQSLTYETNSCSGIIQDSRTRGTFDPRPNLLQYVL